MIALVEQGGNVISFSALIFTGMQQRMVTRPAVSEAEFKQLLSEEFGVYICLWMEQQATDDSLHPTNHAG